LQKEQINVMNPNLETTISALRNFGEPNRLTIISLLSAGPMLVGDICNASGLPLTLVSQHLRVLRESGMVQAIRDNKDARAVWYSLNPERLREIKTALSMVFDMTKIVDGRLNQTKQNSNLTIDKFRVLFLCSGNSARSQMAEALLNQKGEGIFEARSAGTHPRQPHPITIKALEEIGIIPGSLRSKHYSEFQNEPFRYIITVCDRANEECPEFSGAYERIHWSIPDPVQEIPEMEAYGAFVRAREELAARIRLFITAHQNEAERMGGKNGA
jgi:protein-tyrosine-phosphatase/DNA-binding transcriptional ArsR family regulator